MGKLPKYFSTQERHDDRLIDGPNFIFVFASRQSRRFLQVYHSALSFEQRLTRYNLPLHCELKHERVIFTLILTPFFNVIALDEKVRVKFSPS